MDILLILSLCISTLCMSAQGLYDPTQKPPNGTSTFGITSVNSSHAPPPKPPARKLYFDFTEKIDGYLEDEKSDSGFLRNYTNSGSKRPLPNVFYSTDSLVSDLEQLSTVTDLLDENELKESPLYLSFRMMNGTQISDDKISDVFYSIDSSIPEGKLKSLKKHISGILLDIQTNDDYCPASSYTQFKQYYTSQWNVKWDIPFPKYAKRIAHKLLEQKDASSMRVGVMYNETQRRCYQISHQLKHADFIVINVNFEVERRFPLTYTQFRRHLKSIEDDHLSFLSDPDIKGEGNNTEISFKITLTPPGGYNYMRDLDRIPIVAEEIVEETKHAYLPLLKIFAKKWTKDGESELILGHTLNLSRNGEEPGRSFCGTQWFMPYLHTQEVDVTPCQLKTMLGHTANEFSSLVVNEYTWSAFARHAGEITSKNCPKSLDFPTTSPSTYLVFTSGIGAIWNRTEQYFSKLLQEHQTISGWKLDTLIFPGNDLRRSACKPEDSCYYDGQDSPIPTDQGIPKFATEMSEKYKIGCLVEFTDGLSRYSPRSEYRISQTKESCMPLLDSSSVIIWKYSTSLRDSFSRRFNFAFEQGYLKYGLLLALSEREDFLKEFPNKEVIIQVEVDGQDKVGYERYYSYRKDFEYLLCHGRAVKELHEFYEAMQTWAGIHGVKLILTPAYDTQEPLNGLWALPEANGVPSKYTIENCSSD